MKTPHKCGKFYGDFRAVFVETDGVEQQRAGVRKQMAGDMKELGI